MRRPTLALALYFVLSTFILFPSAQYINGQLFTRGLAIIDAPAANSPGHAGSNLNIAVDVSGDGQLPLAANTPANTGRSTSFSALNIFLVSSQTGVNMTVVSNSSFLEGEPSSTVKHLNWPIPSCLAEGNYNLTFYETSVVNGQGAFTITPVFLQIQNPNPSGSCEAGDLNPLLPQPQPSNPLSQSPFAPESLLTLTLTISDGALDLPTVTVTSLGTPTTIVLVSATTVTGPGTTFTEMATRTTVVSMPTNAQNNADNSGFLPVNAGSRTDPYLLGLSLLALYSTILLHV